MIKSLIGKNFVSKKGYSMKTPISIKKFSEKESIYYYKVTSERFENYIFYIGIDPKENRILFFESNDFKRKPIGIIDFKKPNHLIDIPGIDKSISNLTAIQAYKAIQKKDFPNDISWLP